MNDANAQAYAARLIVSELAAAGVKQVVLCPGMRNAPLLFAFHQQFGAQAITHIDERSAAFIALGIAKRSQAPCVVCMTSGSAVANVLPALCEAHAAHVPLIILSADRPEHLHHSGAPQCMQQHNIFRDFVACSVQLPTSQPNSESMYLAMVQLRAALECVHGQTYAPIHINVPFSEPLCPLPDQPQWQQLADPQITEEATPFVQHSDQLPEYLAAQLSAVPYSRVLAVVGADCPLDNDRIMRFIEDAGIPLLADACSGLRSHPSANIIHYADLLTFNDAHIENADLLIRIGNAPLARSVYEYCSAHSCPVIRLDSHHIHKDFLHPNFTCIVRPSDSCLRELAHLCGSGSSKNDSDNSTTAHPWLSRWQSADQRLHSASQQWLADTPWGEVTAAAAVCRQHPFTLLQCSSSMSIRHANAFCYQRDVIAHRGVNGIDGSISSFFGACHAHTHTPSPAQPHSSALMLGDLAFLHDLPALACARTLHQQSTTLIVINNNGGRIFDLLPVRNMPAYEQVITSSQDYHIADIASAFGLRYHCATSIDTLNDSMHHSSQHLGCSIIEICVNSDSLSQQWPALKKHLSTMPH